MYLFLLPFVPLLPVAWPTIIDAHSLVPCATEFGQVLVVPLSIPTLLRGKLSGPTSLLPLPCQHPIDSVDVVLGC